jgi:hypothetical protein
MNFLLRIILIALVATAAQLFFSWWVIIPIVFLLELLIGKADSTKFFSGFYGIAIPWMIYAGYLDYHNSSILSARILEMFSLPPYGFVLVVITGLVGGLVGGFSSLVGGWVKQEI